MMEQYRTPEDFLGGDSSEQFLAFFFARRSDFEDIGSWVEHVAPKIGPLNGQLDLEERNAEDFKRQLLGQNGSLHNPLQFDIGDILTCFKDRNDTWSEDTWVAESNVGFFALQWYTTA